MKKIIFLVICIFLTGCSQLGCLHSPKLRIDKKTGKSLEPYSCYETRLCQYYNTRAKGKVKIDCSLILQMCHKERRYIQCRDEKFRYRGSEKPYEAAHTFQNCWNILD